MTISVTLENSENIEKTSSKVTFSVGIHPLTLEKSHFSLVAVEGGSAPFCWNAFHALLMTGPITVLMVPN